MVVAGATNVLVEQAGVFRIGLLPFLSILQDRRDRAVRAGAQKECPRAGGIEPFGVVPLRQSEDADAGTEPLLGVWAGTQDVSISVE